MTQEPDFSKCNGLLPTIVQDSATKQVLMLGYMNQEAYALTLEKKVVTFFSRSKNRLWMKGETSGYFLTVNDVRVDCDSDAILILASPNGPTCHEGTTSCFGEGVNDVDGGVVFLESLEQMIQARIAQGESESSYVAQLVSRGVDKTAQKVGEEAVEVVIEALKGDRERLLEEGADLLFHLTVLLASQGVSLSEVAAVLQKRHAQKHVVGNRPA
jgi:phosphoribosyl-ATP pyrophosphohydrolase/phosphoribosyl-AMP cyclohydrolase